MRRQTLPGPRTWPIAGGRMSVGLVIGRLGPGASARQLFELARSLDPRRHIVRVYCLFELSEPYSRRLETAGIPVVVMRRCRSWDPAWLLGLVRALRRDAIDVVHAFPGGVFYGVLAARAAGIRTIISSVRDGDRSHRESERRLLAIAYRSASVVHTDSRASAAGVIRHFAVPRERVRVVYDGVDLTRFPMPSRLEGLRERVRSGPTVIAGIGPLMRGAAPTPSLVAAARLSAVRPEVRFIWLRDGENKGIAESLVREHGVPLVLSSDADQVADELPRLSMLWLTTDWHDVADVMLEAMAAARPILVTRAPGIEELVSDGVSGFIVAPDQADDLCGQTDELLRDGPMRRRIGNAARARIADQFGLPQMVRAMATLYEEALLGM